MTVPGAADPGGPLLVLCQGHRCAALHRLADGGAGVAGLSATVAGTQGAVLVTAGCLGRCSLGALAGIAHRDGATGLVSPTLWLAGMQEPDRAVGLARWLATGGPPADPRRGVPVGLRPAVAGIGPAPVLGAVPRRT
ncbi:hypothetical protein [Blastococcus sp. SYSU D00820]